MSMKKKALMGASYVMVAALAIGGTVAYLTDRDNATNTFTMGNVDIELNEDFEQGAELIPGVNIEKVPTITNTGKSDAYVWMTFSIPSALDNFVQGTETGADKNVIHWNPLGATTEGYVTPERVKNAIDLDYLEEGTTADAINAAGTTWNVFNSLGTGENVYQEEINGVAYNTYVLLYNAALESGETTLPSIYNVFLDATVDVAPNGDMYKVVKGEATKLEWNIDKNGAPKIYVNAYGIQAEGFDTVDDAFAAYVGQWDKDTTDEILLNGVYEEVTLVSSEADLFAAVANGSNIALTEDIEITDTNGLVFTKDTTLNLNGNDITASGDALIATSSTLTIEGDGTVTAGSNGSYCAVWANGGNVVIKGGNFVGSADEEGVGNDTIYTKNGGTVKIYGGTYTAELNSESFAEPQYSCLNENGENQNTIVVYGGTFNKFNPSDNVSENPKRDFVASGYKTVDNGDGTYTVVRK